jgi:hypothetical protein
MKWLNERRTKLLLLVIMNTVLFFFPWNLGGTFLLIVLIYLISTAFVVAFIDVIEQFTHLRK